MNPSSLRKKKEQLREETIRLVSSIEELEVLGAANQANGTIAANGNGSKVQLLGNVTIQGGTLTTTLGGELGTGASQTVTLDGSTPSGTVTNLGTYTGADNSSTIVLGTITNTGIIQLEEVGNNTFLRVGGAVTLTGGGTVTLATSGDGTPIINQNVVNSTLTNADNIIQGRGQIGSNGLAVVNQASGVIDANVLGAALALNPSGFTNQGLIEATTGGILQLIGAVFNNLGGNITANGGGSLVQFINNATIQGGTITATGGGALGAAASQTITLDGSAQGALTIAGIFTGADNSSTILVGSINNTGTIQIDAAGNNTFLRIEGGVTLTGAGVVVLSTSGAGTAFINQLVVNSTLTNADNAIRGAGQIGNNGLAVINKAVILASTSGQTMVLNPGGFTNQGLLEAAGGGTMLLTSTTVNNQAGTIQVDGATSTMQLASNAVIQGGTLTSTNSGVLGVAASHSITLDGSTLGALTIAGTYIGNDNSTTILTGTINSNGTIQINAAGNNTFLRIDGAVTLSGTGTVRLSTSGGGTAFINQLVVNSTLTTAGITILGTGQIGNNGLALVNKATVLANVAGQALVLNPGGLTNQGLLEASGGATLVLTSTSFNNQAGTIQVDGAGSAIQFSANAVIQGGTLMTTNGGVLGAAVSQSITLDGNALGPLKIVGTYTGPDNSSTIIAGTINNTGTIQINAVGNNTFLKATNGVTLTGGGTVTLSTGGGGTAFINQLVAGSTLTNVNNLIQGTGQIGNNGLAVVNQGSIEANQSGRALVLNPLSLTNAGLLEGIAGGALQLSNAAFNNSGGSIKVDGGASSVQFVNGAVIQGGTLVTANGGALGAAGSQTITLDGSTHGALTNLGTYTGADNSSTILLGSVINSGVIQINAVGNNTFLRIDGAVNLSGAGTVVLSTTGGGTAFINQLIANSALTNVGNVIQGTGQIGNNGLTVINQGTIDANLTGLGLVLNPNTVTNVGLMEASGGGALVLSNSSINNSGGSIVVDGAASSVQFVNNAIIQSGTIGTANGGVLGVASGNSITLDGSTFGPLTNSGTYSGSNNSTTVLAGTIVNNGAIQVNATGNNTFLRVNGAAVLQGTGTVSLSSNSEATAFINQTVANSTLTNAGNTIQGSGQIGSNGLALVNQGTIEAELAGLTLVLNPTTLTNQGLLEAAAGGLLQISNSSVSNAGGTIEVDGLASAVQFPSGVTIQGGTLTTANNGVLGSVSGNTVTLDGTANAVGIGAGGTYTVGNNSTTKIQGTINNLGTVFLNSTGNPTFLTVPVGESATLTGGGTVTMTASANTINGPALDNSGNTIQDLSALNIVAFTQDGGLTVIAASATGTATTFDVNGGIAQVDGTLNVSNGVTAASAGILSGTGTISGNVTMNGTTQGGDLSNPGTLAISGSGAGNFAMGASGILSVPIGGTTAGSQFSQLNATGTANLSGTLNADLINEFVPVAGNQFTILTAGAVAGQFTTTNFPALAGPVSWKITYNPTSVVLSVVSNAATLVSIAVTPANPSVAAGNSQQFIATGTFSDSSKQDLTNTAAWASSDVTIATVSAMGLASTTKAGSATISATQSGVTGQTTLNVSAAVLVSIALTPKNPSAAAGTTVQFTATGTFSDGSTQNLTNTIAWASSDTTIATINGAGLASALKAGSTTISATQGAVSGQTTLTVTVPNFVLTVVLAGTGSGSVKSNSGGIDCPATSCSGSFAQGTQVALTATAASGSSFTSFAGGGCTTTNPCTVTVNAATTVTATFDSAGTPSFTPAPGSGLTATGNPGDTFIFPLQLTGPPGQTITLNCSPDPTATTITCAVAPATVTLNAEGTTSTFIQVSSFCSWGAPQFGPQNRVPGNWLIVLGGLALLGCAFAARKRRLAFAVPIATLALLMISIVGCSDRGTGPSGRTPAGTYHLTITAKSQSGATGQVILTMVIK